MKAMVETTLLGAKATEGGAVAPGRGKKSAQSFARALGQALGKPARQAAGAGEAAQSGAPLRLRCRLGLSASAEAPSEGEASQAAGEVQAAAGGALAAAGGTASGRGTAGAHSRTGAGDEAADGAGEEQPSAEASAGASTSGTAQAPGAAQVALAGAGGTRPAPRHGAGRDKGNAEAAPDGSSARPVAPSAGEKAAAHASVARTTMPMPDGSRPEGPHGAKHAASEKGKTVHEEEKKGTAQAADPSALAPPQPPAAAQNRLAEALGLPPVEVKASPGPAPVAEAAPAAAAPTLRDGVADGAVLRSAAHLRFETPTMGEMELHLRIRESTAHLRFEGDGARLVEAQAGELQRALAGEGLKLGTLELSNPSGGSPERSPSGAGEQHRSGPGAGTGTGREWEDTPPPPPPPPRRPATVTASGVHVKA